MIKISIVVPVYNTARYLGDCVRSICAQTYADFELLLIDDGSTDGSERICAQLAASDSRIRVFHQENAGVSAARNLALEQVTGSQICFIDSDDWVEPDYLLQFVSRLVQPPALLIQNFLIDTTHTCVPVSKLNNVSIKKPGFSSAFYQLDLLSKTGACTKLYDAQIVRDHNIRFAEQIHYGEDCLFMLEYLKHVELIDYSSYAGYHYMHRAETSLSTRYNSFESEHAAFELIQRALLGLQQAFGMDEQSLRYMDQWLALFFLRVVQSFYRNEALFGLKTRLDLQRRVYSPKTRALLHRLRWSETAWPLLFSAILYRRGYFYVFDCYMRLLVSVRRMRGSSV